jgi:hypothetical protein
MRAYIGGMVAVHHVGARRTRAMPSAAARSTTIM